MVEETTLLANLMIGILLLRHLRNLSDEQVVRKSKGAQGRQLSISKRLLAEWCGMWKERLVSLTVLQQILRESFLQFSIRPDNSCFKKEQVKTKFTLRPKKGITKSIKKNLKRRSAIEPMIGHMKQEGKLGLCRLKGIIGDQINALLTVVGHNLRLILNHIRKFMKLGRLRNFLIQILLHLLEIFLPKFYRFGKC